MLSAPWVWQGEVVQHGRADFGHVLTSGPVTVARGCEAPIALGLCAPWRGKEGGGPQSRCVARAQGKVLRPDDRL